MNPVLKHVLIRLALVYLVPFVFLVGLGLMLRGQENVDIGMAVIGLLAGYFFACILFIFFEAVHLYINRKRVLSYCNLGLLGLVIVTSFFFLNYA